MDFFFFQRGCMFDSAPNVWEFEYDIRKAINDVNPPFDKRAPPFAGATPLSPSGSIGTGAVIVSAMASALIEAYAALARLWPRPVVRRVAVEDLPSESDGEGSDGDVDDTDDNALDLLYTKLRRKSDGHTAWFGPRKARRLLATGEWHKR
jgi:hypothetical protein